MFANFTEETCTGTGATLVLTGATSNSIAFSESFADGDLVAYVLEDSGGTIKVAGVGTYVSATDDITRNDTWSWNGTVIDESPATNITLSGGTHTVRCDMIGNRLPGADNVNNYWVNESTTITQHWPNNIRQLSSGKMRGNDDAPFNLVYQPYAQIITDLGLEITTADGASTDNRCAVYAVNDDFSIGPLLAATGHLSGASTGFVSETLSTPLYQPPSYYFYSCKSDSTTLKVRGVNGGNFLSPIGMARDETICVPRVTIAGAYPATVTGTVAGENNGFASPYFECG